MWLKDSSHTWLDSEPRLGYVAKQKKSNVIATFAVTVKKLADGAGAQSKVGNGKGGKQRTLSRWASGDGANPRLKKIQDLATSLNVEVWQILVPGFDPKYPPQLAGAGHDFGQQEVDLLLRIRNASANAKVAINAVLATDKAASAPKESA